MIVAISGYNASGKTTVSSQLQRRLGDLGIPTELRRFDTLYPGTYFGKKKVKRSAKVSSAGNVGLRAIEGQRGSWDQSLGWSRFANLVAASLIARWIALTNRNRVIVFDRYIYDRCIHFDQNDRLLRLARRFFFAPSVTLVLLPDIDTHERRFLDRIKQRHEIEIPRMSDDDRAELAMVHDRYARLIEQNRECVAVDTGNPDDVDRACKWVLERLPDRLK